MNESLFLEFITKYFPSLGNIIEKVNGKRAKKLKYFHKDMLRREYSADQKWESASVNTTFVAADIVDMDSPLPVKKRDSIAKSNGDLPCIGMKMWIGGKQLNAINIMIAMKKDAAMIVSKLLNDSTRCVTGIDERIEACFLDGLSNGITVVEDAENVGTGVRLNFNYLSENSYGSEIKWGEDNFKPISDIARVLAASTGVSTIMLAKETYNLMRQSTEAKELAANYAGSLVMDGVKLPTPTPTKFDEAFKDEYKVDFLIVDRTVLIEKDGKGKSIKPWNANKIIFLTSTEVGALVYGSLAEETHAVDGVIYNKVNDYTLVSKYSKNDPLREFTSAQAIAAPIIENVDEIYSLDISEAQVKGADEVEGDANFTIYEQKLVKANVITALDSINQKVAANISDAKLLIFINKLSDEDEAKLKAALNIA